jgi:signal transduction histidine kinase
MGMILSSLQLLQRRSERLPSDEREAIYGEIRRAVRRMSSLMEEVLVLSRVESTQKSLKAEELDVPGFCQRLIDVMRSALHQRCSIHLGVQSVTTMSGHENLLRHNLGN